jgi:hypothetical protein
MENVLENLRESLTSPATEKGQILYTIAFVIAGMIMASTGVGVYPDIPTLIDYKTHFL